MILTFWSVKKYVSSRYICLWSTFARVGGRLWYAEFFAEVIEASGGCLAEAPKRSSGFFGCLAAHRGRFGVEFVGVADQAFELSLRHMATSRQGQLIFDNVVVGDAGTGVSLGHPGKSFHFRGAGAYHVGADVAVLQVMCCAVAAYRGGVGAYDADVVEHGGGDDVVGRDGEFVAAGDFEGERSHLRAVHQQYVACLRRGGVIAVNYVKPGHKSPDIVGFSVFVFEPMRLCDNADEAHCKKLCLCV